MKLKMSEKEKDRVTKGCQKQGKLYRFPNATKRKSKGNKKVR